MPDEKKITEENIASLRKLISRQKNDFAVFVGAGSSKVPGFPDWTNLLEKMHSKLNPGNEDFDVRDYIDKHDFPATATYICNINGNKEQYLSFMSEQFEPQIAEYHSLHIKILNVFNTVLTTNYDACFETAINDLNVYLKKHKKAEVDFKIMRLGFELANHNATAPSLVYLHGNKKEDNYVLTEKEYKKQYTYVKNYLNGPSRLEAFLRFVFEDFLLIFIGFSFEDKYFKQYYRRIKSSLREERQSKDGTTEDRYSDYIIISVDEYNKNKEDLDDLKLKPIIFEEGKYIKIENILEQINSPEATVGEDISEASHAE